MNEIHIDARRIIPTNYSRIRMNRIEGHVSDAYQANTKKYTCKAAGPTERYCRVLYFLMSELQINFHRTQ